MPKHNTYEQDENISDNDIVLGSDADDNLKTKNYRIGKLKDYFLSFVETIVVNPRPYKVYTALLTQTGTNAPLATVLENTLGVDINWTRLSIGAYSGVPTQPIFNFEKTHHIVNSNNKGLGFEIASQLNNIDDWRIHAFDEGSRMDSLLEYLPIEIRVYN